MVAREITIDPIAERGHQRSGNERFNFLQIHQSTANEADHRSCSVKMSVITHLFYALLITLFPVICSAIETTPNIINELTQSETSPTADSGGIPGGSITESAGLVYYTGDLLAAEESFGDLPSTQFDSSDELESPATRSPLDATSTAAVSTPRDPVLNTSSGNTTPGISNSSSELLDLETFLSRNQSVPGLLAGQVSSDIEAGNGSVSRPVVEEAKPKNGTGSGELNPLDKLFSEITFNLPKNGSGQNGSGSGMFEMPTKPTETAVTETEKILRGHSPLVVASSGPVIGSVQHTPDGSKEYYAYQGIRYGISQRFQDPEETPPRVRLTVAVEPHLPCPQWDSEYGLVRGVEDCLYLNVFTTAFNSSTLPVVVVIPGYHFSSSAPVAPDLLIQKGVVVVSVNYRQGILGFLSTNDSFCAGNWGLMDLRLALNWVKKNAISFGGNPNLVTLLGHDSGAALVSYLTLDPEIKAMGMIAGAITMSGNALCDWAFQDDPFAHAKMVGDALDCNCDNGVCLVSCLHDVTVEDLVLAHRAMHESFASFPLIMTPAVDFGFRPQPAVPAKPIDILRGGNFTKIPLVAGVVRDEGAHLFADLSSIHSIFAFGDPTEFQQQSRYIDEEFLTGIIRVFGRIRENTEDALALIKYHYYRSGITDHVTFVNETIPLISDLLYNRCTLEWVREYRLLSQTDVYEYVFGYRGRMTTMEFVINELKRVNGTGDVIEALKNVVTHRDELIYILDSGSLKDFDRQVQEMMSSLWSYFIHNQKMPAEWRPITNELDSYAFIGHDGKLTSKKDYRKETMAFLQYLSQTTGHKRVARPEPVTAERTEPQEALPPVQNLAAVLSLSVLSLVLFVGMVVAIVLFLRQKKKTTYITR